MDKIYAMGAYGTGNLGDEAIFLGLLKEFPDAIQIYVNVPFFHGEVRSVWYGELKEGFPESAYKGELIIGGGGIFHSKQVILDFLLVSEKAKQRDMKISIRKVGVEYLSEDFKNEVKDLCKLADFISVRSKKSLDIMKSIGSFDVKLEKDYAYNLSKEDFTSEQAKFPEFASYSLNVHAKTVGLVTGGNLNDLEKIASLIKFITTDFGIGPTKCNVVFIPHTRHYTDSSANDVVTGEMLWSMIDVYHADRMDRFKVMEFPSSVYELLNVYTKVDAIVGLRYHSFIFSEIAQKPLLGLVGGSKARAYFDEVNGNCQWIDIGKPLDELVTKVWDFIRFFKRLGDPTDNQRMRLGYIMGEITKV